MRKHLLLFLALAASFALQAQWADDPLRNNFLANCSDGAGEVYTSTDPFSGDTYVQWTSGASNGWAPYLQRLTFDGTPQWDQNGIHITNPNLASWSPGYAMAAVDGGVVSVFRDADAHHYAVRINADGSFPWGEHGITLFNGLGGDRSEVMAGNDGGVWAMGCDYDYTYLQYVYPNGTLGNLVTIGDGDSQFMFGLLVPGFDNSVFIVYEKEHWAYTYYYEKEIWVAGYTVEGVQIAPAVQLMNPYTMGGSYCHRVVPDGQDGGYAYMWHAGIMGAFNTYVFHFDNNGFSTISSLDGVSVHSTDEMNYYLDAYASVDPVSHDLIIAYLKTDASTQSQDRIYMNRITSTGERLWDEGLLVADYTGESYSDIRVDAFEDGSGFSVIYCKGSYNCTMEAKGYDMNGNLLWTKQMSARNYSRSVSENTTGYVMGQNIIAWVNTSEGGVYAQNIAPDGSMGPVEPPVPTCLAPEDFKGEYTYDIEEQIFGARLTWTAPETQPLHYNLYRYSIINKDNVVIEVPSDATSYFDECEIGEYKYQLTAVYEDCESDFALTPEGESYVFIQVTGIEEHSNDAIVNVLNVYNMNGQRLSISNLDELGTGVYILQGLTEDGRLVSPKVMVDRK